MLDPECYRAHTYGYLAREAVHFHESRKALVGRPNKAVQASSAIVHDLWPRVTAHFIPLHITFGEKPCTQLHCSHTEETVAAEYWTSSRAM